jgi:hypothetical protein
MELALLSLDVSGPPTQPPRKGMNTVRLKIQGDWTGGVVQALVLLLGKSKALSSNPSTTPSKKKKKKRCKGAVRRDWLQRTTRKLFRDTGNSES